MRTSTATYHRNSGRKRRRKEDYRTLYRILVSCFPVVCVVGVFSAFAPWKLEGGPNDNDGQHQTSPRVVTATNDNMTGYSVYEKGGWVVQSRAHLGSYGSSDREPSNWTNLFFPLRNVCYTRGKIHFFQSQTDATLSGATTHRFFRSNREPWKIFLSWQGGVANWGKFDPEPILHNVSMDDWIMDAGRDRKIHLYHGTSFVVPPHLPHNMFHVFNDLIIPLFRDALLSGAMPWPDDDKTNLPSTTTSPTEDPKTFRNLFLLTGNQEFIGLRVIMFDVLFKLFHRVHYPLEDFINDPGESISSGRAVCMERYIWKQPTKNSAHPLYAHMGRFDERNNDQWKGIVPALRDAINRAFAIPVPERGSGETPTLVWASRTHNQAQTCDRCIVNEADLLKALGTKFNVKLLPIHDRNQARETNLVTALRLMAQADIFGGLHGAGLGHALFLQPGSAVFEMRDRTHWNAMVFLNEANHLSVGYYAYDARPLEEPGERQRFVLKDSDIATIVDGLWEAWEAELRERLRKARMPRWQQKQEENLELGTCVFPLLNLSGRVSSFNSSRCYLSRHGTGWRQQSEFVEGS